MSVHAIGSGANASFGSEPGAAPAPSGIDQQLAQLLQMLFAHLSQSDQWLPQDDAPSDDDRSDMGASGDGPSTLAAGSGDSAAVPMRASGSTGTDAPHLVVQATPAAGQSDATQAPGSAAPLSTTPQTTALTPDQSKQAAQAYVSNLQQDFGLTKDQAAGIVANLWHESGGMNSGINQGGAIGQPSPNMNDDNANGYGIAQWGGSRKQGLLDYASQHGLDPSSEAANYGYLKQELQTTQAGAIDAVKATNNPQDATEAFCNAFEKPSDPEMDSRLSHLPDIVGA
ncbi:phage tail tip lysozyme [Paraburkholderia youngii]|uniref:phage tail tip lysozyme n=1 Tax=Paraburkholderia youngii TaxID=2782701 RepID=UPI003D208CC4